MSSKISQLKPNISSPDKTVTKLFNGATYLAEKNKELARAHLLRVQILLAQRPIK